MILNNLYEHNTPLSELTERELDTIILRMGSFLSIISNKKANQAKLLITVVNNKYFRQLFQELDIDNTQLLVKSIVERFPNICKSKVVSKALYYERKQQRKTNL